MKIETAHTILIVSAIAFFAFYGVFESARWWKGGGLFALGRAVCGFAAAAVFAVYLRSFLKSLEAGEPQS